MRPLLLFFIAISIVYSSDSWEGDIIRASSTDCSACQLAEAGFSQQIPDSLFSGLSEKCSLLPAQYSSVCETGLSTIIDYIKEGLKSRIPNCTLLCAKPSPISSTHFCSLIHPAFTSLDALFSDLSSTLIPTVCLAQTDRHACVKKIEGLLKIVKTPVTNLFKRVGILLECEQFKAAGDPGKFGADWTTNSILCTGCQTTLKGISVSISHEGASHLVQALHNTFQSTCELIRKEDASLLQGAPACPEAASILVDRIRKDDGASDHLCQITYGCPPMRSNKKEEL